MFWENESLHRRLGDCAFLEELVPVARKRRGSRFEEGGQDLHYHQLYFEANRKLDPFTTTQFVVEIEEPKSFLEVIPYGELIQTRIYRRTGIPQGIVYY